MVIPAYIVEAFKNNIAFRRDDLSFGFLLRHRCDLPEFRKGLEDKHLWTLKPVFLHLFAYRPGKVFFAGLIKVSLVSTHFHIENLFDLLREIFGDIALEAPQYKGIDLTAKVFGRVVIVLFLDRCQVVSGKIGGTSEHRRIQESEERVKLHQIVLHWGTADSDSFPAR